MSRRFAAILVVTLLLMAAPAGAQSALPGGIGSGPQAVGFRILTVEDATRITGGRAPVASRAANRARTLRVHVWYPAKAAGTPLTIADYLEIAAPSTATHRQDMPRTMGMTLDEREWTAYTGFRMTASRDAAPAVGAFPLIVGMLRPVSVAASAEHLASHGYVVAYVERQPREIVLAEGLEREALILSEHVRDMEVAIARLRREPFVDPARLGAHGFSGDGLAQLVLAMRHPDVDAVALLETGWLSPAQVSSYQEMTAHDPLALRAPLLYAYSENLGRNTNEHIADITGMRYAPRSLLYLGEPKMTHWDFATEGMVLASVLDQRAPSRDALARASQAIYNYQRTFFDAYVKGDAAAIARIAETPSFPSGGSMIELTHMPAIEPALSRAELQGLLSADLAAAMTRARADLARDPNALVFEEAWLNQTGYMLLQRNQQDAAIALLTLAGEAHPQSANTFDSLSEILETAGRKADALAAAERGLALLPGDTAVPAPQRPALEAGLRARIARLR